MTESETIEYKKSLAELSEGLHSVAAILNKHGRGILWFGIKNDGTPVGMDVTETNAARVFFAKPPALTLRCAVFATPSTSTIIDQHDFTGDILTLIEEAEKYILKNIRIGMRLNGLVRVDVPEIDRDAFREAIINAFCHRDYRDPDEVRIAIFPDRVEVRNPGTLMEGVTLRTLRTAKVSRRRNPLIAELLRRIHLIEAWGRGIPLILEKAPNVRFSQVAGIFITEFPRPVTAENTGEEQVTPQVTPLLGVIEGEHSREELQELLNLADRENFRKSYLLPALEAGCIERTIPDKPNSRLQKYQLTRKGRNQINPSP